MRPIRSLSLCLVGTHDPTFTRTLLLRRGLETRGVELRSLVVPSWGATAERVATAQRGVSNAGQARRLCGAYAQLVRALRLMRPQPRLLYVGYPAQLDVVVLRMLLPNARIIADGFVSLDETLADRRIGAPSSPTRRLARALDRLAFRLADRVVVDSAAHRRRFAAEYGLTAAKAIVVPVGAPDPGMIGNPPS